MSSANIDASTPGTYALIMRATRKFEIQIGKLGSLHGMRGYYVYVGSAFGPGGVQARLAHHQRRARQPHWHIDYLRLHLPLTEIWYTHDNQKREHAWARLLSQTPGAAIAMPGFGASDCKCASHLVLISRKPVLHQFRTQVATHTPEHAPIYRKRMAANSLPFR